MKIEYFTPPGMDILNYSKLPQFISNWHFASKGRWALYYILDNLGKPGNIIVSPYICETVLEGIEKAGWEYDFYDIDFDDLNPSVNSIREKIGKGNVDAVLCASMYGNPADILNIEALCIKEGVFLIDDAAQSFGASLEGRYIGQFGDAGFISFSPGKPAAAHLGALYFTEKNKKRFYTNHYLTHRILYWHFYKTRIRAYETGSLLRKIHRKLSPLYRRLNERIIFDKPTRHDWKVIINITNKVMRGDWDFRIEWFDKAENELSHFSENFRMILPLRGKAYPHKLVFQIMEPKHIDNFCKCLKEKEISYRMGYKLLCDPVANKLPNSKMIEGTIIEFPIEDNDNRMNYMISTIKEAVLENL